MNFNLFHNFGELPFGTYVKQFKCYPVIMMGGKERKDVDKGGKIILPPSALDHLTRLHIQFPMLFKLTNKSKNRETHCGVLEFVAEEGRCYLPYWMMKNLILKEGEIIEVKYVNLEVARFVKFQPQSVDFLEISNPKAVLENSLRNFATLTKGDVISINYNDKDYEMCILETRPGNAVSIIECDMDVDFAPPVGYQEPERKDLKKPAAEKPKKEPEVHQGYRLDGKPHRTKTTSVSSTSADTPTTSAAAAAASAATATVKKTTDEMNVKPYLDYQVGLIRFIRDFEKTDTKEPEPKQEPQIKGYKLKHIGVSS